MKKLFMIAALLVLTGCDSKHEAPFGLKWGQGMDSISFIDDVSCIEKQSKTTCAFGATPPFSDDSDINALDFNQDGLFKVQSIFIGGKRHLPDFDDFKIKLNREFDYLKSIGFNQEKLTGILDKCNDMDACDDIDVSSETSHGAVEVEIWRSAHDGDHQLVVTFSN